MKDRLFTFNFKSIQIPTAFILSLLVIFSIEAFVYYRKEISLDWLSLLVSEKYSIISERNGNDYPQIVVFGDSQIFHVNPGAVAEAFNLDESKVINLSWPFFGAEAYEYVWYTYINKNKPPDFIIMNFSPTYVAQNTDKLLSQTDPVIRNRMYLISSPRVLIPLLWRDKSYESLYDYVIYLSSPPSLRHSEHLNLQLKSFILNGHLLNPSVEDSRRINEQKSIGSFTIYNQESLEEKNHIETKMLVTKYLGEMKSEPDPIVLKRFENFLSATQSTGTQVILLNGPLSPLFKDLFTEAGALKSYNLVIKEWESKHQNFHAIQPYLYELNNDSFGDPGHVNRKGNLLHQVNYIQQLTEFIRFYHSNNKY